MTDFRYHTPTPIINTDPPSNPPRKHSAGHHYLVQDFPASRFEPARTVERRITKEEFDRLKREEHLPQVDTTLATLRHQIAKIKEIIGHKYKYKAPSKPSK